MLGLFSLSDHAALAARALHADGIDRPHLSIVARSHDEAGALACAADATPGVEIEDSPLAAILGELGAVVVAAAAIGMPGVAPFVAAGPLSAELGEAAGHLAGGIASILTKAGIDAALASSWQSAVEAGSVILGAHVSDERVAAVERVLSAHGAQSVVTARWRGSL